MDLIAYVDVLIKAFREDAELKRLLENLSGGNLRLALEFLASFVGTGYVSTQRILETADSGRKYLIPIHEFMRAIIFGEYEYYDPKFSEICNLYAITSNDGREHFLLPLILGYVQRQGKAAGCDGYVQGSEIYGFAQGLGFLQEQVGPQIARAIPKRLLQAPPGKDGGGPYRITSVGSYTYKLLVTRFTYNDAMIVDTPITDVEFRRRILDVRSIGQRLERAEVFRKYLDSQWKRLPDEAGLPFDWSVASVALAREIADVRGAS